MDKATYGAEKKPETNVPELHTVEDVYEWIDKNIEYGWLGQDEMCIRDRYRSVLRYIMSRHSH